MSLQKELDAFFAESRAKMPVEAAARVQKTNDDLRASGLVDRALKAGDSAPEFALPNAVGHRVALSALLAAGPVVVSFYRGGWCPYCNLELRAYQRALPEIRALGASLVAISPQTPDSSLGTAERNALEFEVLSDHGSAVARSFGIAFELPDVLKPLYAKHALSDVNGTDDWRLPVPATYVIARDRRIALAHIDPDYRVRLEPAEALAALRTLAGPAA